MKLYLIVVILLGCVGAVKKNTCTKIWGISTNYLEQENILEDSTCSNIMVNLTDSICIKKYFLDSLFSQTNYKSSFTSNEVFFQITVSKKHAFLNDSLNVFKIYWSKDNTGYNDFSSFILYTKEYGIVYKSFRKKGKEFFNWRLLNIKYPEKQLFTLNDFTNTLSNDTLFFEKSPDMPKQ